MKRKHTYIFLLFCLLLLSFAVIPQLKNIEATPQLITQQNQFTAGEPVSLSFKTEAEGLKLIASGSLGTMVFEADSTAFKTEQIFHISSTLTNTSGLLNWTLVNDSKAVLEGSIHIEADIRRVSKMESYLGPQRIAAGGKDYAQLTLLATDIYDNPLPNNTKLNLNTGFETSERVEEIEIQDFISWKNIFSTTKSGRIFVAANFGTTTSKLQTIYVDANLATSFKIEYSRPNSYADSDQITTFQTDIIKDVYDNIIPDATLVNFVFKTNTGEVLQASGNTINGIAQTQVQHPKAPQNWLVTAFITGIAKSETIKLSYNPAVETIPTEWNSKSRILKVGKLSGMLDQTLPEGTVIHLEITTPEGEIETLSKKTESGMVTFQLKKEFYPTGSYTLKVTVLGVTKTLESVELP